MDPAERRRLQNRLAQRKFRQSPRQAISFSARTNAYAPGKKKKREEAQAVRIRPENKENAGGAYTALDPQLLDESGTLSGLPWGSFSMSQIIRTGQEADRAYQEIRRQRLRQKRVTQDSQATVRVFSPQPIFNSKEQNARAEEH